VEIRPLGKTGLQVSALGFGCGSVGGLMVRGAPEDQVAAVRRALDAGITYFDTAPSYGDGRSEEALGRALHALHAHNAVVLGTKLRLREEELHDPYPAVRASLTESLVRLGRPAVDLVQLHNQLTSESREGGVSLEQAAAVADAMRRLVHDGLTSHIGFTGMGDTEEVRAVIAGGCFDTVQSYFNALNPSAGHAGASGGSQDFEDLIGDAAHHGMGVIAIRVMAGGALVGHEERVPNASPMGGAMVPGSGYRDDVSRARRLAGLATELGMENTMEMGVRFVLAKPGVSTALVGISNLDQLEDAIRWAERGPVATDAVERIVAMNS
jgi:L-galactose dehydrogenase/L-glyceraldehyde 3-phosphate reductase